MLKTYTTVKADAYLENVSDADKSGVTVMNTKNDEIVVKVENYSKFCYGTAQVCLDRADAEKLVSYLTELLNENK